MSRASSIHEAERQHGSVGELHPFDKINPFKRLKPSRTASTSSTTLEDVALGNRVGAATNAQQQSSSSYANSNLPNVTPAYMPATFDTSSGLRRMGSQPAVTGLFGGASPPEEDEGYPPVRSEEEALARHASLRDRYGPQYNQNQSQNQQQNGAGPTRTRSRGLSLVGAAANFAVAGFGMGESDQELVGRTLSRVSTHKSYQTARQQAGVTVPARTLGAQGVEEEKEKERRSSGSDHTRIGEGESSPSSSSDSQAQLPDPEKTGTAQPGEPPLKPDPTEDELYMVRFEPGEKTNPKNWSVAYRWYITGAGSLLVLNSTFSSSAPSGVVREMTEYFGFGQEVATLTVSLFVAG